MGNAVTNTPSLAAQSSNAPVTPGNVSGLSDSNVTFNQSITTTDHGAIAMTIQGMDDIARAVLESGAEAQRAAMQTFERAVSDSTALGSDAIRSNEDIARAVIDGAGNAISNNTQLARDSMRTGADMLDDSLRFGTDVVKALKDGLTSGLQDALDFGRDNTAAIERVAAESQHLAGETIRRVDSLIDLTEELNDQNLQAYQKGLEAIGSSTNALMLTVEDLNEARSIETQENLKAVKELAEVVQTNGESIQANVNKVVLIVAALVVGAVAWRAVA